MALTKKQIKKMLKLYRSSPFTTIRSLASKFGISPATMRYYMLKHRIPRKKRGPRVIISPKLRARAIRLYKTYRNIKTVADKLGLSYSAVYLNILKKAGIKTDRWVRKVTQDQLRKIKMYRKRGYSLWMIGHLLNISPMAVHYHCLVNGWNRYKSIYRLKLNLYKKIREEILRRARGNVSRIKRQLVKKFKDKNLIEFVIANLKRFGRI